MELKYLAFRRWLYTPIIIWKVIGFLRHPVMLASLLIIWINNLNSIDQQTDYEIQFIVHRDSRCQRLCSSKSPLYSLGTNDMSWCYRIWRRWTLQTPWPWVCCSIKSALLTMLWKASSTGTSKKFVDPKDPFQPFTVHWKKTSFCCWKHV